MNPGRSESVPVGVGGCQKDAMRERERERKRERESTKKTYIDDLNSHESDSIHSLSTHCYPPH